MTAVVVLYGIYQFQVNVLHVNELHDQRVAV